MATKGPQTPQPVRRLCRGTTPPPAGKQNGLAQTPRSLQRSGSLRVKGEAARAAVQAPLRREKTADSLRPRPARAPRGTAAGTPSRSPEVVTSRGEVMTSRGACSLPQSPTLSRRSSTADNSWETQSVLNSSSPFSTEGISCNGTTFSSRHNKYLIHCAKRVDDEHYLTPTQRTTRDIKRLRGLLDKAHETIQQKDAEIHRLKQEVITLRLRSGLHVDSADPSDRLTPQPAGSDPADLSHGVSDLSGDLGRLSEPNTPGTLLTTSTPDTSNRLPAGEPPSVDTTDAAVLPPTGDAANLSCPASPRGVEAAVKPLLVPSVGDSGTFDCLTSPSISSKESVGRPAALELEERLGDDWEATEHWIEWEEKRLREESERRIAELNRQHGAEYQEMKEKYNDKVEGLLQKLTEANGRYFEIRPLYDASRLRVGQLELELEKALNRADRRAETRDISAQTAASEPSRVDTRHTSVQTAAVPARVAAESQTVAPPSPQSATTATMTESKPEPAVAESVAETAPEQPASGPGAQEPLSTFQQQHMATRPENVPERIQVTAMVHSPAETSGEASGETDEKAAAEAHGSREAANGDPEPELDWPSELTPPVTKQPQTVPPPSPDEPVQFAVPFTRYFAHVAAQGPSNPGKRSPMPNGGPQMAAPSAGDAAQVAAPAAEGDERVSELTQRLSQTETELERVRSLYCQQLALLEDSQRQAAAGGEEGGRRTSLEMDPPMRLQFLKSAVFHYLTDKDDYVGHMRAISAVLQFSDWELQEVERVRARKTSHS